MSTSSTASPGSVDGVPAEWAGFIDDAAIFPPGNSPLADAVTAFRGRRNEQWYAPLVSSFVVSRERLPDIKSPLELPISLVINGGPGVIAETLGKVPTVNASVVGIEVALRDEDDLPGAVERTAVALAAARADGALTADTPVYVELPQAPASGGWLDAVAAVSERGLRLKFRTGGLTADLFPAPSTLAAWIAAAVGRDVPFKCTAGLHRAIRHSADDGFVHHGFLNLLLATDVLAGGADIEKAVAVLGEEDHAEISKQIHSVDISALRRRFVSYGSCSVIEPLDDLLALGLMEGQR